MRGVWEDYERAMRGVWEEYERSMRGVWEDYRATMPFQGAWKMRKYLHCRLLSDCNNFFLPFIFHLSEEMCIFAL
jgi:hypothetical protein